VLFLPQLGTVAVHPEQQRAGELDLVFHRSREDAHGARAAHGAVAGPAHALVASVEGNADDLDAVAVRSGHPQAQTFVS
jgi:hypothetical protein